MCTKCELNSYSCTHISEFYETIYSCFRADGSIGHCGSGRKVQAYRDILYSPLWNRIGKGKHPMKCIL